MYRKHMYTYRISLCMHPPTPLPTPCSIHAHICIFITSIYTSCVKLYVRTCIRANRYVDMHGFSFTEQREWDEVAYISQSQAASKFLYMVIISALPEHLDSWLQIKLKQHIRKVTLRTSPFSTYFWSGHLLKEKYLLGEMLYCCFHLPDNPFWRLSQGQIFKNFLTWIYFI